MKILTALKHIFVPHDQNDFKPHLLREVGVSVLLFLSIFLLGSSAGSSFFLHQTVLGVEVASSVLIDLTNESRLAYNQSPLVRNAKLDQAAALKGRDMASKEYFSHNSPTGVTPWYWFKQAGYNFLYAGENLAINFTDSADVEKAWLESPTHRANIMNVEFREIGMATVRGTYNNYPTIYIVQLFGTPAFAESNSNKNTANKTETDAKKIVEHNIVDKVFAATTSSEKNIQGDVKGVLIKVASSSVINNATNTNTVATTTLEKIVSTQEMAIVKDTSAEKDKSRSINPVVSYSTWYEKILFKFSSYIDFIYKALLVLIAIVLVSMILVEIRKQHFIHIMYGIFLLLLLTLFIYINQSFF